MDSSTFTDLAFVAVILLFVGLLAQGSRRDNRTHTGPVPRVFTSESVRVIDGDTIHLRYGEAWVPVRLHGIDAPEIKQRSVKRGETAPLGMYAREVLDGLLGAEAVTCEYVERDKYGRVVGLLSTRAVHDVNRMMVRLGWAQAYIQYGGQRYVKDEAVARRDQLGMWEHEFLPPWTWRQIYTGR